MEQAEAFELERRLPIPMRFVLGAFGLFCILAPTLDLGRVLLQIGWWTPFFAFVVIGAWTVGGILLAAARAKPSTGSSAMANSSSPASRW